MPAHAPQPAPGDQHYQRNLHLIVAGVKTRAPGIRRCRDQRCGTPFIAGTTDHAYCPTCRPNHSKQCKRCERAFPIDDGGGGLCPTCSTHPTLF